MKTLPSSNYINVRGIRVHYQQLGTDDSVVLAIHGHGGFIESWGSSLQSLAKKHTVVALDLPGFGRSEKPKMPYSVPFYADFIDDFLRLLNIQEISLLGHSMGGAICLHYALSHAEKVKKIVLVDSAGLGYEGSLLLRIITLPLVGELALSLPAELGSSILARRIFYDSSKVTKEFIQLAAKYISESGGHMAYLTSLRSMATIMRSKKSFIEPIKTQLHVINQPTLIIWGRNDVMLPLAQGEHAHKHMPNTQIRIIEECGHAPHLEQPSEFNELIASFL